MPANRCTPLAPAFRFAGFTFPRYVADLPASAYRPGPGWTMPYRLKTLRDVLRARRASPCGGYYHAPTPGQCKGWGFYLPRAGHDDEGASFRLRVTLSETTYSDPEGDTVYRGIVARLPHGRGFLAGWTMGEGMASSLDARTYRDERDAMRAADRDAESTCEEEAAYQARWRAAQDMREEVATSVETIRSLRLAHSALVQSARLSTLPSHCARCRARADAIREEVTARAREIRETRETLARDFADVDA